MVERLLRNLFAALLVVALIAVPAFALQGSGFLAAPPAPPQTSPDEPSVTSQDEDDGPGQCHGIQRAYWAVTGNPGQGEGKAEAAAALVAEANERGCELSDAPADWPSRGRPDWAGGPPPWAGEGRGPEERGQGKGNGRKGPPWASEDDSPPWGMAWGHWLNHDVDGVCARISARLDAHPNASVPEDLRSRIETELGCSLPD